MRAALILLAAALVPAAGAQGPADPFRGLLITEISLAPVEHEGIELFNSSDHAMDISGAIITDRQSSTIEGQAEFPPGTVIEPGEFLWVFTSVSPIFVPDIGILAPGTQVFQDGESPAVFEGEPVRGMVNRIGNVNLSDIGDDVSLLVPGTERPVRPGEGGDRVIDAVFAGTTVFIGGTFLMGPDAPSAAGDFGLFPPEGFSLHRFPPERDTDRMLGDFILGPLTAGRGVRDETPPYDPLSTALIAEWGGSGHLTVVTGLPDSPEVAGTILTRSQVADVSLSPDGDAAILLDSPRSIVSLIDGLAGAAPNENTIFTPFDEGFSRVPAAVRHAPGGSRATLAFQSPGSVVTLSGLPGLPTIIGDVPLPSGNRVEDLALSPVDPDLGVVAAFGFEQAIVIRGLTSRDPDVVAVPVGAGVNGLAITPSGQRAIVCNTAGASLTIIDDLPGEPHVGATLISPEIRDGPQGIAVSHAGDVALVTNSRNDSVTVLWDLDGPVPRVGPTLPTGAVPAGVAFLPDGATAVVANALQPGLTVIGDLLPDPTAARVVATLTDPRLAAATFAEQSVMTFPPPPFEVYTEEFEGGDGGWVFVDAAPLLDAPVPGASAGSLGMTAQVPGTTFGTWFAPPGVTPLLGGSLHSARLDAASGAPDPADVPDLRARLVTFDGSLVSTVRIGSHGEAQAAPGSTPSPVWTLLSLPPDPATGLTGAAEGGGNLAWDLLHFDPFDPVPASLRVESAAVLRRTLDSLGDATPVAEFDFTDNAEGWAFLDVEPAFPAASGRAVPDLLVTEVRARGDEVGQWISPAITGVPTDRLTRITFRVGTDITPASAVPTLRLRVFTLDFQVMAGLTLFSAGEAPHGPASLPRSYALHVAPPRRLRDQGVATFDLAAAFDVVALDPSDAGGVIFLDRVTVETLPLPPELE